MRLIQALAISIPAWILCYLLLSHDLLWLDEWPDLVVFLTIIIATVCASTLAFSRCDISIVLSSKNTIRATHKTSSRANIAFLITGLFLGGIPALIWVIELNEKADEIERVAEGVTVLASTTDLEPGDPIDLQNLIRINILRQNLTDAHFNLHEMKKVIGAKANTHIPAKTPLLYPQLEGVTHPPDAKVAKQPITRLQDLQSD